MRYKIGFLLALAVLMAGALPAHPDAITLNFDQVMLNVWGSAIWIIVQGYDVLPPTFTLDPDVCDINGGVDMSVTPIMLYPNGLLDSDEFALMAAILANSSFDCTATGGASHQMIHDGWTQNYNQTIYDLGGNQNDGDGDPLLPPNSMIPDVEYLFAAMMTLGDPETTAFPLLILDFAVNEPLVNQVVGEDNLHIPDLNLYSLMSRYLAWCGDADGDGASNFCEYLAYYPGGGRAGYLAAAMDPVIRPADCGLNLVCDGSGGLFGEYFATSNLTPLRFTRIDHRIDFDWKTNLPDPALPADFFSIRWTGWVKPAFSEVYTFYTRSDDGVRLWIDGQLVINDWNNHGVVENAGGLAIPLVADQEYAIKLEYYEFNGPCSVWLGWQSASQPKKQVYEFFLRPGTGEGDFLYDYIDGDWIRWPVNGHYYKLTAPMTWPEADTLAQTWGGYLTTVNNIDEQVWEWQTFGPFADFFIGLNDVAEEGTYVWANGETADYRHWAGGQPDDWGGVEEYVHMVSWAGGFWNDNTAAAVIRALVESETGHVNVSGPFFAPEPWIEEGNCVVMTIQVRRPYGQLTYQWRKEGFDIPDATLAEYVIPSVILADEGVYSCVVSDEGPATGETSGRFLDIMPLGSVPLNPVLCGVAILVMLGAAGCRALRRAA